MYILFFIILRAFQHLMKEVEETPYLVIPYNNNKKKKKKVPKSVVVFKRNKLPYSNDSGN